MRYYDSEEQGLETNQLLPVEEEDGVLWLVEVGQLHPLQDGVVDFKVTLPIRCLCYIRMQIYSV